MSEIHIGVEKIFKIGDFIITNSFLSSLIISLFLIIIAIVIRIRLNIVPSRVQHFFELIIETILNWMDSVLMKRSLSEKYLPFIATLFIFILLSNWIGLLPGVGSIGLSEGHLISFIKSPATDLNSTIALGTISVLAVNIFGGMVIGFKKYLNRFFNFKNPIFSFVGFLELLSEFIKIVSFSFRLFGNIFAGKVLIMITFFFVPYFIPIPFLIFEVFVGFIQAFIFAKLTLVFIAMSTNLETH